MDQRLGFIAEFLKQQETITDLCQRFNISRKTGHKWIKRYTEIGVDGLHELTRRPHNPAYRVLPEVVELLRTTRQKHPKWGPRKIIAIVARNHPALRLPSHSTVSELFRKAGLIHPARRRKRIPPYSSPFADCAEPNDVWCADFKGWFRTADGRKCEPLTITDACSRFLLKVEPVTSTRAVAVKPHFEAAFREFGLPRAIRTDNGPPFASLGAGGLSHLSIWWIRLGIVPERIEPGHPEQNGRHERMHGTMKVETAMPPKLTATDQVDALRRFRHEYNHVRPHEGLGQRPPSDMYQPSPRQLPSELPEMVYPSDYVVRQVKGGQVEFDRRARFYLHSALAGELVGFKQLDDRFWQLFFGPVDLGVLDTASGKLAATRKAYERAAPVKHKKRTAPVLEPKPAS